VDTGLILQLAMYLLVLLSPLVVVSVFRSTQEETKAWRELILRLSKNQRFIDEVKRLQQKNMDEQEYCVEIAHARTLILEQVAELKLPRAKVLEEPLWQRNQSGRTGYIEQIAEDVMRTVDRAAA
jgi:hypothetical protein